MSKIDVLVRFKEFEDAKDAFKSLAKAEGIIGFDASAITFEDGMRFIMDPFYSAGRTYHEILVVRP